MFPLLTVTRSHKNKTHHNKTLALGTELETHKCYLRYRVFWGWVCKAQRRTCGSTTSCAFLRLRAFLSLSDARTSYRCKCNFSGTVWRFVNEMCMGMTQARSGVTKKRVWVEIGGLLQSEHHAWMTSLQSKPKENHHFQNNRAYKKKYRASVSYAIQQDLEGNAARINGHYLMKTRHPWE